MAQCGQIFFFPKGLFAVRNSRTHGLPARNVFPRLCLREAIRESAPLTMRSAAVFAISKKNCERIENDKSSCVTLCHKKTHKLWQRKNRPKNRQRKAL